MKDVRFELKSLVGKTIKSVAVGKNSHGYDYVELITTDEEQLFIVEGGQVGYFDIVSSPEEITLD